jgi:hypothetical protein
MTQTKYIVLFTHQFIIDEKLAAKLNIDDLQDFDITDHVEIDDYKPSRGEWSECNVDYDIYSQDGFLTADLKFVGDLDEKDLLAWFEDEFFYYNCDTMGSITTEYGHLPAHNYIADHHDPYKNWKNEVLNGEQSLSVYITPYIKTEDGLLDPKPELFQRLRDAVENNYDVLEVETNGPSN